VLSVVAAIENPLPAQVEKAHRSFLRVKQFVSHAAVEDVSNARAALVKFQSVVLLRMICSQPAPLEGSTARLET
jgi:hypothetical protein